MTLDVARRPGHWTDLAVLRRGGSRVVDAGDHLVVTSPANPGHHFGNCLVSLDDDARTPEGWQELSGAAFPDAGHCVVLLDHEPTADDRGAWERLGFDVEAEQVLSLDHAPSPVALDDGLVVRPVLGDDWELLAPTADDEPDERMRDFLVAQLATRRRIAEAGVGRFWAAWDGDRWVSFLGIVDCGQGVARYQHVVTRESHRRRGLAGHLLGVAGRWALGQGSRRLVIVVDPGTDAERLYRRLGFTPAATSWQAYRASQRP